MARRYHRALAEKIAAMKVISEEVLHGRNIDHNMTILLGIASSQELDIKAVLASQKDGVEQAARIEDRLDTLSQQVDAQFTAVNQRLDALIAVISSQGKQP
jgi:histidinol phosphatase-like enzyme